MEQKIKIEQVLDKDGRIIQLPRKHNAKLALLSYLADRFTSGTEYTEHQVNDICNSMHTFDDCYLLRRELVDNGFLERERNGSSYRRICADKTSAEEE